MNFKEAIVEYQTDLTPEFMQGVIDRFDADDRTVRGCTGKGVDENWKRSEDLFITELDDWGDEDTVFFESLTSIIQKYHVHMNSISESFSLNASIADLGYQIQKTREGEFYHWHHDAHQTFYDLDYINSRDVRSMYITTRLFTYIIYLNDRIGIEDGRTQFKFGDEVVNIEPKAGKCLMFPANELYTHRGETLLTGEKYLMTGWVVAPATMCLGDPSDDDVQNFKGIVDAQGGRFIE